MNIKIRVAMQSCKKWIAHFRLENGKLLSGRADTQEEAIKILVGKMRLAGVPMPLLRMEEDSQT